MTTSCHKGASSGARALSPAFIIGLVENWDAHSGEGGLMHGYERSDRTAREKTNTATC